MQAPLQLAAQGARIHRRAGGRGILPRVPRGFIIGDARRPRGLSGRLRARRGALPRGRFDRGARAAPRLTRGLLSFRGRLCARSAPGFRNRRRSYWSRFGDGLAQRPAIGDPQIAERPQTNAKLIRDARDRRARVIQRARFCDGNGHGGSGSGRVRAQGRHGAEHQLCGSVLFGFFFAAGPGC